MLATWRGVVAGAAPAASVPRKLLHVTAPVAATALSCRHPPQVANACFSRVKPAPLDKPRMVAASESALALLGLPLSEATERTDGADFFAGNKLPDGAAPVANCYCGYQFGYFSGQLGDGAAMTLGEVVNDAGERFELQLKGAGKTPYSRTADGRKVLRSSLREFLCSEAMHSLGVPTTRAGTVVTSDSKIVRDVFYTGRPEAEQCSVITRMAPTFLRFGSFEIFKTKDPTTGRSGPSPGNTDLLNQLVDYTCNAFFKDVVDSHAPEDLPLAFPDEEGLRGPKLAGTEAGAATVFGEIPRGAVDRAACGTGCDIAQLAPNVLYAGWVLCCPRTTIRRGLQGGCAPHRPHGRAMADGGLVPRSAQH